MEIGVPLAPDKTVGPSTAFPFLCIVLDTVNLEARLPEDYFVKDRELLLTFHGKQKVTFKELQQFLGYLGFLCFVIQPGRPFLRRLTDCFTSCQFLLHCQGLQGICLVSPFPTGMDD